MIAVDASGNYLELATASGIASGYLPLVGGTLTGNLYLSGASILPVTSGTSDLGSAANPFRFIFGDDLVDTSGTSMFLHRDGSNSMFGTLNGPVFSGTVISGDYIYVGGNNIVSGSKILVDYNY